MKPHSSVTNSPDADRVIRRLKSDDVDAIVNFSLRAWAPNFASFEEVLGPALYRRIYPDWLSSQAEAVANVCHNQKNQVWVSIFGSTPVGFIAVAPSEDGSSAEIDMIAVDPGLRTGWIHCIAAGPLLQAAFVIASERVLSHSPKIRRH